MSYLLHLFEMFSLMLIGGCLFEKSQHLLERNPEGFCGITPGHSSSYHSAAH